MIPYWHQVGQAIHAITRRPSCCRTAAQLLPSEKRVVIFLKLVNYDMLMIESN